MSKTRKILLTKGKVAIVDVEDYDEISSYRWHVKKNHGTFYAVRYENKNGRKTKISMHRQIMKALPGQQVDHRHRNGLNNRRCELRFCTTSQNNANRRFDKKRTSKYKGVSFDKKVGKWKVYIKCNGKRYYRGAFCNEIDAAKAYDKAAKKLFKDFAVLNFECETGRSLKAGRADYGAAHPQL
jgi:hypothetical protein